MQPNPQPAADRESVRLQVDISGRLCTAFDEALFRARIKHRTDGMRQMIEAFCVAQGVELGAERAEEVTA